VLGVLGFILDGIVLIGTYALWAIESAINAVGAAFVAAAAAAFALLPSMSSAPAIGTPTWLGWLSWFYPVGDLLTGLAGLVTMWLAFLAVRYVLRLVRAL
jgi:protein-S-isoprenylcysteine O-methyltransferase Ste14